MADLGVFSLKKVIRKHIFSEKLKYDIIYAK